MEKDIVFFDGVCNLCASSVQFIIRHDKKNHYMFSSLQSPFAIKELQGKLKEGTDSIVLLRKGKLYTQSGAVLRICMHLAFPLNLLAIFIAVPKPLRDLVYNYIAKHRYSWYGKKEQCWIPDSRLNAKFIA